MRAVIAEDLALLRDGLARLLRDNEIEVLAAVGDGDALVHAVMRERPDIVINAAAYTAVDRAESEPDAAWTANCTGPANLAAA